MLGLLTSRRILLFTGATDMRKGFDGLMAVVMAAAKISTVEIFMSLSRAGEIEQRF